jgi:hypothetical protein
MKEDCIDTLLSRTNEYKEKLAKLQGKELGSINILNKEEDKTDKECEKVNEKPPSYHYIENIPYIKFIEGSLQLMWDKRKGKPKYDEKSDVLWLGPYIVKKKFEKGNYYFSSMDGRKMLLPSDGSLLRPFV